MTVVERTATKPQMEGEDESDVNPDDRQWVIDCIQLIRGELKPQETELTQIPLASRLHGLQLFVKREADQPSGSHKHRLAAALLIHALASGRLTEGRPVVEASSGSTAISEAWYCRKLGIPFYAVVPDTTAEEKRQAITDLEEIVVPVSGDIVTYARRVAERYDGHFMDQFTYAERGEEGLALTSGA